MSAENLREVLVALPGVAFAEVDEASSGTPTVRVWLDGSRTDAEVRREVGDAIARGGYRQRIPRPSDEEAPRKTDEEAEPSIRRTGLGRGLETLIPIVQATEPATPSLPSPEPVGGVVLLVTEESERGTEVRAENESGAGTGIALEEADAGLDVAIVASVSALHGLDEPATLVASDERVVDGTTIVSVLVESAGRRHSGSVVLHGGRSFAFARAVDVALALGP